MAPPSDDTIAGVMAMLRSMANDFAGHAQKVIEVERKLDLMLIALGGEDALMDHRLFHERERISSDFWTDIRRDTLKGIIRGATWAILLGLVGLMGTGIIYWVQHHLLEIR